MGSKDLVVFASPAWVDLARVVLDDLVTQYEQRGITFSICEKFMDAPPEFADKRGVAAWHFYVNGNDVRVGRGSVADTDVRIRASWALALPGARQVYTPEFLAEQQKNPTPIPDDPHRSIEGDMSKAPSWLMELHNRLAVMTV